MDSLLYVIALSLLPAVGNFSGGLLAEFGKVSGPRLNKALHAASGIVIAVVAIELMPTALQKVSGWLIGVMFAFGGAAYIVIENALSRLVQRRGSGAGSAMWMIYVAVAMDLFSDGILIGSGSAVSFSMALVLALGQVLADVPEGYATIANLKDKNVPRARRLGLSALLAVPVLVSGIGAWFLLRDQDDAWKMAGLTFTAGLLTVAAVEDMVSEAHESAQDTRWSVAAFVGGFVLFTFVSAGLGG